MASRLSARAWSSNGLALAAAAVLLAQRPAVAAGEPSGPPAAPEERAVVVRTYANGAPAVRQLWRGARHVRDEHVDQDGIKTLEVRYSEDGRRLEWFKVRRNGSVAGQWATEDGRKSGEELAFDEDGRRISVITWHNGRREGRALEFDRNGNISAEVSYHNDVTVGPQTTYYETGQRRSVCPLQDGRRHGLCITLAPEGYKLAEIPYVFGAIEGLAKYFAADGKLAASIPYRGGVPAGPETQVYPSGKKRVVIPLKPDGTRDGDALAFDESGAKTGYLPYRNGVLDGWEMRLDHRGNKEMELEWRKGERCCTNKYFWPSGRLRIVQDMVDLARDGTETHYFDESGGLRPVRQMIVPLVKGKKQGHATVFFDNGTTVWSELEFENDMREGIETRYYETGQKKAEYGWHLDKLIGKARTFWKNGKLQSQFPIDGGAGTGLEQRWDDEGHLRLQVEMIAGKKQGEAKVFDDAGEVVATLTFVDDVQDGPETRFRAGKPIGVWMWKQGELISSPPPAEVEKDRKVMPPDAPPPAELTDKNAPAAKVAEAAHAVASEARREAELARSKPKAHGPADSDGIVRTFWPNGKLQSSYPVRGRGTEIQFHDNGEVSIIVPVVDGQRNGIARIFDRGGALWGQVEFVKGQKEGEEIRFGRMGEKVGSFPFRHGMPVGIARTYYPDGSLQSEFHHDASQLSGVEIQYHRGGRIRLYVPLRFGKRHGTATIYTEGGVKWAEVPWREGRREGEEVRFDRSGVVVLRIRWIADKEAPAVPPQSPPPPSN